MQNYFVFISLVFTLTGCNFADAKLKKVLTIFRHGDRSPAIPPYPTDPNRNYVWPDGLEMLTVIGRNQGFQLGSYLSQQYRNFLTFNPKEVYARSSSVLRCILTTGCVLTGIYSPSNPADCFQNTGFTPSPVYTINPRDNDHFLFGYTRTCKKVYDEIGKGLTNSKTQNELAAYRPLLEELRQLTGNPNLTLSTDLASLYDLLLVEEFHNLTIPTWFQQLRPQMLQVSLIINNVMTQMDQVAKPLTGYLLYDILGRLTTDEDDTKLYLYGTHDLIVMSLMKLMGIFNDILPPYTAALIIEVHKEDILGILGWKYVEIYYRNSSTVAPYRLLVPGCPGRCSVKDFVKLTQKYAVADPQEACRV